MIELPPVPKASKALRTPGGGNADYDGFFAELEKEGGVGGGT